MKILLLFGLFLSKALSQQSTTSNTTSSQTAPSTLTAGTFVGQATPASPPSQGYKCPIVQCDSAISKKTVTTETSALII